MLTEVIQLDHCMRLITGKVAADRQLEGNGKSWAGESGEIEGVCQDPCKHVMHVTVE